MEDAEREILLEEYRQLMESQRDNTRITYSWMSSLLLILCPAPLFFGFMTDNLERFVPAMVFGLWLCMLWAGLTEVFARYIKQRFERLAVISGLLDIPSLAPPERRWQARTFVWLFVVGYVCVWVLRLVLVMV